MDVADLELKLIEFTDVSPLRWKVRRFGIGFLLVLYFLYAFVFTTFLLIPHFPETSTEVPAPTTEQSTTKTNQGPFGGLITKTHQYQLALMATFGFLGGLFAVTRTFVLTTNRVDYPAVWYLTRPLLSILMAWFFYYAFLAGQLVFYSGDPASVDVKNINVYSLAVIAIIAGVFTERAYNLLRKIALKMFKDSESKLQGEQQK